MEHAISREKLAQKLQDLQFSFDQAVSQPIEFKDNKVDLYLKPRYFLEWNRFNYFKYKLEKLSALIELINSDSKN